MFLVVRSQRTWNITTEGTSKASIPKRVFLQKKKIRYWNFLVRFITFEHISKILRFQKSSNSFEFHKKVKDRNIINSKSCI